MKIKRMISALLLTCLLAALCAGCQPPEGMYSSSGSDLPEVEQVAFTVWCPDDMLGLVTEQVNAYTTMHSDTNYQIIVEPKSAEDAAAVLTSDPMSAAEVFMFNDSDMPALIKANSFSLISRDKPNITLNNSAGSVSSGKPEEWMYGYPYAVQSEYILIYDKSVVSDEDAASLDAILAAAASAGKSVYLNAADGSATAGFFLGAGCKLGYNKNGRATCDFEGEEGLAAFDTVKAYLLNENVTDEDFLSGIGGNIAAGMAPSSMADEAKELLGADFGAAALPSFTLDGEQAQMYSIGTYMHFGLRRMLDVDLAPYIMDFCYYLTGADNQLAMYTESGIAMTNLAAMENPDYQLDTVSCALSRQSCYSTPRYQIAEGYWQSAQSFAEGLASGDAQTLLEALTAGTLGK